MPTQRCLIPAFDLSSFTEIFLAKNIRKVIVYGNIPSVTIII